MNVLTIILTFVVAYVVFITGTYFLARVFFPLEDTTEKSLKKIRHTTTIRNMRKQMLDRASSKVLVNKAMA
ncbi:hypothetical protein [Ohtaekwangia koreensis]|uniref:Uncharacterized protein n=1 Tax=Ohtaekwangia koreensis TaxID=688867 RepID=A0A1T5JKL5_9BACT|nr:hypothetical protein [Ohtaekwangia koreensis]SKC51673.1 hypothetical protein SAMN05660236_1174 [Ohtaekwangia koreensis]